MEELQPFTMPLDGRVLIEASAGTGKTYSITGLYLRHLLESGLGVERILVVTFTNAATEELRRRIRGRLTQALRCLESPDHATCDEDPELARWLSTRPDPEADRERLRTALVAMDQAAVFTIHGFCQRVLQENAFDTGVSFEFEFIESEDLLRKQAAEDFWRQWFAEDGLPIALARWVLGQWRDPAALLAAVSDHLASAELTLLPRVRGTRELTREIGAELGRLGGLHRALRESWRTEQERVRQILAEPTVLNRKSYNVKAVQQALAQAQALCDSGEPLLAVGDKFGLLTRRCLEQKTHKGAVTPENPFFDRCDQYLQALESLKPRLAELGAAVLGEARAFVRRHLQAAKERAGQLYFDDLLSLLDEALRGAAGERLAAWLRERYPVAMIDEFQDTDALQYRIFSTLYGRERPGNGLYLIGDPKQAIYRFRGGDIHTYLKAAGDAHRRYALGVNWRSGSRLVHALNRLFGQHADPFRQEGIPYQAVAPCPRADAEPLRVEGREPRPLVFWRLALTKENGSRGRIKVGEAKAAAAAHCAHHIAGLLRTGRCTLGTEPLRARDIAILVRTHGDTPVIRDALRAQGINSVALSDQSVFESEEAGALLNLLQAVARCEDERRLRHALADRLLRWNATEIDALLDDEAAWEAVQQRFLGYRQEWQTRGFIQAFQRLARGEGLVRRLLALPDGERCLTNVSQLVELLQQASASRPGMEELLRWLADQKALATRGEAARLRLESDEALVKIVTMHASKGLEYPVVYIPFPWSEPKPRGKPLPWFFHDAEGRACLYLGGGDAALEADAKARKTQEEMAERVRLFYVAVTRAARLCVLTWGPVNGAHETALAWLLHHGGMKDLSQEAVFQRLDALAEEAPAAIEVSDPPAPQPPLSGGAEAPGAAPRARPFATAIERHWRVNSYSGLIRNRVSEQPDYDALPAAPETPPTADPVQALPAGSGFGLLLHQLLEEIDFTRVQTQALRERIGQLADRFGLPEIHDQPVAEAVVLLVENLLDTELPAVGLRLRQLPSHQRANEMEFHFPLTDLAPQRLQEVLAPFPGWRDAAQGLHFPRFRGLMHGFIDLVFRHDGRYYLADYKSNRLDDYGEQGLREAMREHHYPLQGLIYALALHRHLRLCLPDYRYEEHFGGLCYLFARGMRPGTTAGIWFRRPEADLIAALERCIDTQEAA